MISCTEWLLANAQSSNPIPANITMIRWCQHQFFKGKPIIITATGVRPEDKQALASESNTINPFIHSIFGKCR